MILETIFKLKKAIFLSPYINFNYVLGLNLAKYLLKQSPLVYIFSEFDIPSALLNMMSFDEIQRIFVIKNPLSIEVNDLPIIVIADEDFSDLLDLNSISFKAKNIYIFSPKISLPKNVHGFCICKVRKVSAQIYSIQIGKQRYLIKNVGAYLEEVELFDDVKFVVEEVKELIKNFGSVKASDFVKYCIHRLNYDREECVDLIRKALSIGVIKYVGGYLLPSQSY